MLVVAHFVGLCALIFGEHIGDDFVYRDDCDEYISGIRPYLR